MFEQQVLRLREPAEFRAVEPLPIERPRILGELGSIGFAPVRILCAPHGGGKTTAVRQYAASDPDARIVTLPAGATREQVAAGLAAAANARLTIVDHLDGVSPDGLDALFASIESEWPRGKRYLLSGSSRAHMRVQSLVASGLAEVIDTSVLPFSSAEIAELARAWGVTCDQLDAERLRYDTDGWPIVVTWVVRDAARGGRRLRGAFEHWCERNLHLLLEFVTEAHGDRASSEAFVTAIRSLADPASQRALERLDAAGYPVVRTRTGVRPYRVLMHAGGDVPVAALTEPSDARLVLKLFGRFSCRVADRAVAFGRRRDQNVLTYVALAPGAAVPRAELLATFWPDALPAVASQGLRTTLFRLRRAISEAAGCPAARYLRVDHFIALDPNWVSIDARSFRDRVELAGNDDAGGDHGAAHDNYLLARHLYSGELLASEAVVPQLASRVVEFDQLFNEVLGHVVVRPE